MNIGKNEDEDSTIDRNVTASRGGESRYQYGPSEDPFRVSVRNPAVRMRRAARVGADGFPPLQGNGIRRARRVLRTGGSGITMRLSLSGQALSY